MPLIWFLASRIFIRVMGAVRSKLRDIKTIIAEKVISAKESVSEICQALRLLSAGFFARRNASLVDNLVNPNCG
jgi:hypothetical protein